MTRFNPILVIARAMLWSVIMGPTKNDDLVLSLMKVPVAVLGFAFLACIVVIVSASVTDVVLNLHESRDWQRLGVLGLIVVGIIGGLGGIVQALNLSLSCAMVG